MISDLMRQGINRGSVRQWMPSVLVGEEGLDSPNLDWSTVLNFQGDYGTGSLNKNFPILKLF